MEKYGNLSDNYHFVPVGIETHGAYGPQGITLVKQIGKNFRKLPVKNYPPFLFQSISMAIQQGNAVCVMDCPKNRSSGLEGLFNFHVQNAEML